MSLEQEATQVIRKKTKERLLGLLGRFVMADDARLTDVELVDEVHTRWLASREDYIIDPNE
jgi:hypothetical protein